MNRQQRRKAEKATPKYLRGTTQEQRKAQLFKNGITIDDLKKEYKTGYEDGFREACPAITKTLYAAVILALRRDPKLRFGRERCRRVLCAVDSIVMESLTSEEAIDTAFEEVGLYLDFKDPIDPIKEAPD